MKTRLFILLIFSYLISNAQDNSGIDTWSIGGGAVNTIVNGDLTSVNNLDSNFMNVGFYLSVDKMITPAFGFEIKGQALQLQGFSQELSSTYPIEYTNYNTGDLYFEGETFGGEFNVVINLNGLAANPYAKKKRKLNYTTYFGLGYHSYNSELFSYTDAVGFSYTPIDNLKRSAMYYTAGLGVRYYLNKRVDLELRQNFNFNTKDDLDAAVTQKQAVESFYTTQLGLVIKLFKKGHQNIVWNDNYISEDFDTDGDGVVDRFDKEPNTPKGAKVYADGYAVDFDKDGIINLYDKCPLKFGPKDREGCPIDKEVDTDGDLIPDFIDKENDTPKGAKVYPDGTAFDTDKDGVIDFYDKCILIKGSKEFEGCPKDSDNDGVYDTNDLCPNIPGPSKNNGCPIVAKTNNISKEEHAQLVKIAKSIYFSSGKYNLRESSKRELEKVVDIMSNNPDLKFIIEGHTDSGGQADYNMTLSQNRANSVKNYLVFLGIDTNRLKAIGYGFSKPNRTNRLQDGRELNRRVEIKVDDDSVKEMIDSKTHLVLEKETLFSISKQYNVTVEQLKAWNNLTSNTIIKGDRIIIQGK